MSQEIGAHHAEPALRDPTAAATAETGAPAGNALGLVGLQLSGAERDGEELVGMSRHHEACVRAQRAI
jgi:hypothetical protein